MELASSASGVIVLADPVEEIEFGIRQDHV